MPNVIEILVTGRNLTKPAFDEAARNGRQIGQHVGDEFTKGLGDEVEKKLPPKVKKPLTETGKPTGKETGKEFVDGFDESLGKIKPVVVGRTQDAGKAGGVSAGTGFAGAVSPLILGAFAAVATAGPGLILAGTAAAVVGAGALIAKGNTQVSASYQRLGNDAASAVTQATAPLVPQLLGAVGVLDDGIGKVGPELKSVFAAVAPDARDLAGGLVSLVSNTLPGMTSALRSIAPYSQEIAADFGKIGSGIGGLLAGLGSGASGGMAGFNALADVVGQLLPDIGQLVGVLANGLGPALHDIASVALPVANGLTAVVGAFPPGAIRAAADATLLLFGAFKLASLAGILAQGATFLQFLKGTAVAAPVAAASIYALEGAEGVASVGAIALGAAEAVATTATTALGAAASAALGPWGMLAAGIWLATENIRVAGVRLGDLNPVTVYKDWDRAENSHSTIMGQSARVMSGASDAVKQYAQLLVSATPTVGELSSALSTAATSADSSAQSQAAGALSALGLRDGSNALTVALDGTLIAYSGATTAAGGYNSILQALNGTTATLDDAQNSMAQDLLTLKTSFTANGTAIDLNTQAGVSNRQSLSSAAKAAVDLATAQYQASGDMGKANQTLQDQENAIVKATGATGKAKQAIIDYLNQIMKIPPNVTTNVNVNTKPAQSGVVGLLHWIDDQSANVDVYASPRGVSGTGRATAGFAHGGIKGAAASGGIRSNLTWVGEHGVELVDLPPGTRVHSNPDSMRMAAQAAGAGEPVRVVLEWAGASSDPIFEMLREGIRVRGGNAKNSVQVVLGQNF